MGRITLNEKVDKLKNRKAVLLKACYDLLKKCRDSSYVLSAMDTTVFYDDTDCDGYCLMEDIAIELGIEQG